ncbi:MAG: aminotransferase class V-fold PLP-dependent enzyme [Phycisphaeraceae bacterium]|nr:aminotransferase class V-fold PLP-dependent enzyme [Phycisphaeraceae bacterium]
MADALTTLDISAEFPIVNTLAFFNHAGVAPISARAADAVHEYARQASYSAYVKASWYARARQVKAAAAKLIGATGEHEIAFIANTSAGLNLVARGLDWQRGDHVVITNVEYPANRYPWEDLTRLGVRVTEVAQLPDGSIDVEEVIDAITDRTRVVAISHVQYASGFRIDLKPIADMVHKAGGYLCVDAIQSVGAIPFDVHTMGVDFLAADGHKWMLAPEGCGIFYCRHDLVETLHPAVIGWMNMVDAANYGDYRFEFERDARRFEPGSYNIPGILALGAGIELLLEVGMDHVWSRIDTLTTRLCEGLAAKRYRVFSPRGDGQRSGIVSFDPPGRDPSNSASAKQIVADLQKLGIIIVMREGRLRASPHFYNTEAQIDRLIDALP